MEHLGSPSSSSGATSSGLPLVPVETASEKPEGVTAAPLSAEDEMNEAMALGLSQQKKKDVKAPKAKRTHDQIVAEEVDKLHRDYESLIQQLEKWPDTPSHQSIGALDRKISKQIKSMKDAHEYQAKTQLEKLATSLEVLRTSSKAWLVLAMLYHESSIYSA